jgi:DivIVA domain-containing protein
VQPASVGHTRDVVSDESSRADGPEKPSPAAEGREPEHGFGDLQFYVPQDILDVSFPVAVRGYDRRAVDAYIKRVNRVIAELKVRSSPPAAVRHALEQAEAKAQGLLRAAREAGDEITTSAQRESEQNTANAKAEAAELLVNTSADAERIKAEADQLIADARTEADAAVAKAQSEADELRADAKADAENTVARAQATADERMRRLKEELAALREQAETRRDEIHADTEAVSKERHELLEDVRRMAASLVDLANAAAARSHGDEPGGSDKERSEESSDASREESTERLERS